MIARKTSFTDSTARKLLAVFPLPVAVKNMLRLVYHSRVTPDTRAFGEPGTLNNQQGREMLVRHLLAEFKPAAILETGSYMGAGIKFFLAHSGQAPVFSCEINKKFYHFCKTRFAGEPRVHLFLGQSVEFLTQVSAPELHLESPVLVYLDAHWGTDLPLKREIEIILKRWPGALIIIDDFQVPHDTGYGYDEYGKGQALNAAYVKGLDSELLLYYPALKATSETGARRGCCFVCMPRTTAAGILAARPDYFVT